MNVDKLIKQSQNGDETAFAELLRFYYDSIYACAWRWCGDKANAEDITQNTCLRLVRKLHQFDGKASFTTWLYRLTINCAKDFYKSPNQYNKREQGSDLLESLTAGQADQEARLDAQRTLLRIAELGSDLADAVLLVHVQGLNHRQAAKQLNIKESTVSWRIHEARKQLKHLLQTPAADTLARGQT